MHEVKPLNDEDVYRFLKNLLDPEMYGWAVTAEVRGEARRLLGKQKVETNNESLHRSL
jgi:hypothetical protein